MCAVNLRDQAVFQRRGAVDDGYGNVEGDWSDLLTVYADLRERTGKEALDAGAITASRMATLRIRFSPETSGITEADRVVARGTTWNIRSIAQTSHAPRWLDLLLETGVAT